LVVDGGLQLLHLRTNTHPRTGPILRPPRVSCLERDVFFFLKNGEGIRCIQTEGPVSSARRITFASAAFALAASRECFAVIASSAACASAAASACA
jgi:hypothetical protein